jgi:serine/threonine-protein kinase
VSDFDLRGAILEGRYQVTERIAEGAMGSVWRAERMKLGRQVAIKIMHEQLPDELASRERFEREAKLMARLDHPNCVAVIDFGIHGGMPFLVMELVRGTSLQELMDREPRFEPVRAVEILRQVLSGLAHAHELGIVHRDIKPSNLMVGEKTGIGLQVRILDFGLARLTDTSTKLTTGIVVGTPNYMAPEQCKGTQLDGRSDLYACGVILFELLTGRKPFVADDPYQVVRKHLHEPAPRLADAVAEDFGGFEVVIARSLAKSPEQRFATAQDMAAALDNAIAGRRSFGHAVPHPMMSPPSAPQVATVSGWAVPGASSGPTAREPSAPAAPASIPAPIPPPVADPASAPVVAPEPAPESPLFETTAPGRAPPPASRSQLPFTHKQLAIAGGGLLVVIAVIAIIASRHGNAAAPTSDDRSGTTVATGSGADAAAAAAIAEVEDLIRTDDKEAALEHVLRARRQFPDTARLAWLAGRLYFSKLYWTDGIHQFRDAIRLDPAYRSDPELIKTALRGFITTPDVDDRLEEFLRADIGEPARPYLEETARDHPNSVIRARAASELRRFH